MRKKADTDACRSGLDKAASPKQRGIADLTAMAPARLRIRIDQMIKRGWIPAIEHTGADGAARDYWYIWKLPMFGETDVDRVLAEVETCRRTWPAHLVRLVGYDNLRQSQRASVVIHEPAGHTEHSG